MRVLILSCNTGGGHNAVSAAIQEAFAARGADCETRDALAFLSERASEFICNWHTRIYRYMPGAFKAGYRFTENHPALYDQDTLFDKFLTSGVERLGGFMEAGHYDITVCPHVFSALMVTRVREQRPGCGGAACFVATDYTCSPMANESRLDRYFIPAESLVQEFTADGIPAEKLVPLPGIPVRRSFFSKHPKKTAKKAMGMPEDCRHILIMFGSMGCGPVTELTGELLELTEPDTRITVVCGTNEHLKKKLKKLYGDTERIRILGYAGDIDLLMDSADLYVTKPGGISTAEAAVKGLPMVLVNAVSGCEEYNLRHFCGLGGAVTAEGNRALAELCADLLASPERLEKMSGALGVKGSAAEELCRVMTQEAEA